MADNRQHQRGFSTESPYGFIQPMGSMTGFDLWGPLITNMQAWTRQMTQFNALLHHEWLSFVEKRLKQDTALSQQLAECKGPDDIMRTYSVFMSKAFEDYQHEFTAVAKLSGAMTGDALGVKQAESGGSTRPNLAHDRAPQPGTRRRSAPAPAADTEH